MVSAGARVAWITTPTGAIHVRNTHASLPTGYKTEARHGVETVPATMQYGVRIATNTTRVVAIVAIIVG
jgi:hypothetical protein